MGKILKILLAACICAAGFTLAAEMLTDSGTEIPVISDLLNSVQLETEEKELNIDTEPFYEIEDTALFNENESVLENQAVSLSYDGESFSGVSLQISQVNLAVLTADGTALSVETEEVSRYQAYVQDEILYIIIEGTLSAQSAVQGESALPQVSISLPSDFAARAGTLKLELLAGNVALENVTANALELKLNAGVVSLQNLNADQLTIMMLAGSVTGQGLTVMETTSLTMSAGSMSLSGDLSGEVGAKVTAGNLSLSLEQPYENYDCQIICAAGSVTAAGETYSGLTATETIRNGGANTLTIDCSVGMVEVTFSGEET